MILFLTYHRVRESAGPGAEDFYTVSGAQLARHIELLHTRGFQNLKIEELISAATVPENKFVLSFDDATADHYEVVFPVLQKHHCQGLFFIPTAKLNRPGYLTNAQVQEMAAAGHAIGFHSHEHRRLDVLPEEEIRRQIALSQKIVADIIGVNPVIFVPPGGFMDARIRKVARDLGVRLIRTMRWGYNKRLELLALQTIPINRFTNEARFLKILESHDSVLQHIYYSAKEGLKRMIPSRSYERLRALLFKFSKSD